MSYRNIQQIILYSSGIVVLRDPQGRQIMSMQGHYGDVIDEITKHFKEDKEVKWIYRSKIDGKVKDQELDMPEWCRIGIHIPKAEPKTIDISEMELGARSVEFEDEK